MKKSGKNDPGTLSEWLEIATRRLAAPGKERISREIEAHYAEAVQARVAQGEPVRVAEAGAVADLGDPVVAAKRFRRTHFTTLEAKCIANLSGQTGEGHALIFGCLPPVIFLLFAWFVLPPSHPKLILNFFALLFAVMIFPAISMIVLRRPISKARTLSILWLNWVYGLAADFALLLICFLSPDRSNYIIAVPIALSFFQIIPTFLTWNKTRKMTGGFDETTGMPG